MPKRGQFKKGATKDSIRQRKFNSRPAQKKRRAARNKDRRKATRSGRVHKGDGKDIDHKDFNPKNHSARNKRVVSRSKNRARNQHAKRKR